MTLMSRLGDHLKYFYQAVPEAATVNVGDLNDRLQLKNRY